MYYEDRLTQQQLLQIDAVLVLYKKNRLSDNKAYSKLCDLGLTDEEADELMSL